MGFTVPTTLPPSPAYGLPPNVIRASFALNLIQTDAFQFATSRRRICNLFNIDPLPGGGATKRVAMFWHRPLATASGDLHFTFFGTQVKVTVSSITAGVSTMVTAGALDAYAGTLTGVGSVPQLMKVEVADQGGGSLAALFLYEASLTAAQLP